MAMRLFIFTLCLPVWLSAQTLYKYTDENGRIHYTDRPPDNEQAETLDIKVKSYMAPAQISERLNDYAAVLKPEPGTRITIYTTDWCGVCKKAKRYMDDRKIAYSERDIEKSAQAKRDYDRLGGKGVPLLQAGQKTMHGFSPRTLDALLAKQ